MSVQTRNAALKNEIVRLYFRFLKNGELSSPAGQPAVEILGPDGATIIDSLSAIQESPGIFYVDWFVPQDLDGGTYFDRWTFQWSAGDSIQEIALAINVTTFDNYLNFVGRGVSIDLSRKAIQLMKDLKDFFIYEACHIPMYWEQAMRVQEEGVRKKVQGVFFLTLEDDVVYNFNVGDVYFHNGQKYTVFDFSPGYKLVEETSSSSESSEEESSSSESSEEESSSSESSEEESSSSSFEESASSSDFDSVIYEGKSILTLKGAGNPQQSGTMTIVSGDGDANFTFTSFEAKKSRSSTVYKCVFRNWDRDWKPIVRLNGRITEDGWYADYDGNLYFDRKMTPEDVVEVTYKFACFSEEDLIGFLRWGLMQMNAVVPASESYRSLDHAPYIWYAPILLAAAIQALKRAIFAMTVLQEKRAIYGGADDDGEWAKHAMETFKGLYTDYTALWDKSSVDVKKRLPQIAVNVTPEYTLPGGRSRWFRYLYK